MLAMLFSNSNVNKTLAVILVLSILTVAVVFGILGKPVPESVSTIFGVITGFVSHALGVNTGVNSQNGNSSSGTTTSH